MTNYKCEHCGTEVATEDELEIDHRACRLKAAFPAAYTEQGDGLITFDTKKVAESLGMFSDIVIGRDGQPLHPLEGDLHIRISAGWLEPDIWIEIPIQIGNHLSSLAFRLTKQDWLKLIAAVSLGLDAATKHIEQKKLEEPEKKWRLS